MARDDAHAVMHLHTPAGQAVSAHQEGLLPLTQTAMLIRGDVSFHDYEGVAVDLSERERLVADLGTKNAMILRNHGTLAVGKNVGECFVRLYFLERACQAQIMALSAGNSINHPPQGSPEITAQQGQIGRGARGKPARVAGAEAEGLSSRSELRELGRSLESHLTTYRIGGQQPHIEVVTRNGTVRIDPRDDRQVLQLHPRPALIHVRDDRREYLFDPVVKHHSFRQVDCRPADLVRASFGACHDFRELLEGVRHDSGTGSPFATASAARMTYRSAKRRSGAVAWA